MMPKIYYDFKISTILNKISKTIFSVSKNDASLLTKRNDNNFKIMYPTASLFYVLPNIHNDHIPVVSYVLNLHLKIPW